ALLCTSPGGAGGSSYPLHELASRPTAERLGLSPRLLDTRFTEEWLATHHRDPAPAEIVLCRRVAPHRPQHPPGAPAQLEARRPHDVWDRLGHITCPTLVASGEFDGIAPVANGAAIASRIPGAELRVFEGGHLFMAQDPDAMPAIIDFLRADA